MLSDPISIWYDTALKDHVRVGYTPAGNVYTYQDAATGIVQTVTVKQSKTSKRLRHEFRVARAKIATNALTSIKEEIGASCYLVIDEPVAGFTDVELNDMAGALTRFIAGNAPSNTAMVFRILAGEA